jgi:hypothetical protein
LTVQFKRQGADRRYIPVLVTAPGVGWINAYTIASEIGAIGRRGERALERGAVSQTLKVPRTHTYERCREARWWPRKTSTVSRR